MEYEHWIFDVIKELLLEIWGCFVPLHGDRWSLLTVVITVQCIANIKSSYCIPETKTMLYVNMLHFKKDKTLKA